MISTGYRKSRDGIRPGSPEYRSFSSDMASGESWHTRGVGAQHLEHRTPGVSIDHGVGNVRPSFLVPSWPNLDTLANNEATRRTVNPNLAPVRKSDDEETSD